MVSAFDTEGPETSEASGFVVDSEIGLILTNRHVACAGPFVGEAIFHDHEEVDVYPVYRDPVHDFGVLKFDPAKIKYQKVTAIPLAPQLAKVGLEIRVVGNDAGEKLSILAGSISRLDRNAPDYGEMTFNDFNTFYLQAASSTSGGSSGSPVLDIHGNAVALQAGGHTKAATDFFFPLDRVVRALEYIKTGKDVPRGTIQAQMYFRPFDEARRLGLRPETEELVRKQSPGEIGMLVCETVVPLGPASGMLEEGDVLISVNGTIVTKFVPLASVLDDSVGKEVQFEIERGGEPMKFSILVQDLHSITPDRYVEVGGAKVNNLSYQLARQFCVPCSGVYVCEPAGIFRFEGPDHGWIVDSIDNHPTPNLDALIEAVKKIPDRQRVPVTYYSIADVHLKNVAVVSMDRHWSGFRMAVRNDKTGLWDFTNLGTPIPPEPQDPATATFAELDESLGPARSLFRSIVKVSCYMPTRLDGYPKSRKQGAGLVVDAENGIILVSRNIVPTTMGDVSITFAESIIIWGRVIFLHPTHNLCFLSYDPKLLGNTPVMSAPLSDIELAQGHRVHFVALNHNYRPVIVETTVADITAVTIPQCATPRFRAVNFDSIQIDTPLASQCSSGFLTDAEGRVQGLWLSFLGEKNANGHDNEYFLGVPSRKLLTSSLLDPIRAAATGAAPIPELRGLAVELTPIQIAQARHMGLSDAWVRRVELANPVRRQVFMVRNVETDSPTARILRELDIILAVDHGSRAITKVHELDVAFGGWAASETVRVLVLREKREVLLTVPTSALTTGGDGGTSRVVLWAGAMLQAPHRSVLLQSRTLPSGVYVSGRAKGSPAYMYGLAPTQWVTHVNGIATPTLDALVETVKSVEDGSYVRVKVVTFDGVPLVLSTKMNSHYWPTVVMSRDPSSECGWSRTSVIGDQGENSMEVE
ncbi:trypsin-like cysteine/serine peptidase domain-containing protein [Zopfochytrium polystomum]|nr:trypsin-like cysteine/serine peptidase domain-containing protein [Zopfochytrium polystomum]